ncbi:MAG: InlB B-repeat-containing protein, partial [Eubacteriales bacterium]
MVIAALTTMFAVPASAAYNYPMSCSIYYKDESGNTLATTKTFSVNAADADTQTTKYYSPSVSGYSLKNSSDSYVTYSMMDKYFPASNYIRNGTATYTVYYVKNESSVINYKFGNSGRTAAASKTVTGKPGSSFTVTSPSVTGYTPNKSSVTGTYGDGEHIVYYYEKTYTVSYNANGGSGAPASQIKSYYSNLTLSSTKPTRTGYSFMGWATDSSASSVAYLAGGTYSENGDATLYAVWSPNTYTVRYNANGGSGAPSVQTKIYGKTLTLSSTVPTRSGYTFIGWGLSGSSTYASYQPGDSYSTNASRTFYAVWEKNPPATYTVAYNANGGSGAPTSQTKTEDVTLTLSSTKPTRSGYTFLGWGLSPTSTSASYQPGGSYTSNSSVTLYAVWSCNHSSTKTVWDTGCDWRKVCNTCGATVSSGTTHGPYTYGEWEYANTSEHKRTKDCNYGDYSTVEYESHSSSTVYYEYSETEHMKYLYCSVCSAIVGTTYY